MLRKLSNSFVDDPQKQSSSGLEFSLQGLMLLWKGGVRSCHESTSQWANEAGRLLRGNPIAQC